MSAAAPDELLPRLALAATEAEVVATAERTTALFERLRTSERAALRKSILWAVSNDTNAESVRSTVETVGSDVAKLKTFFDELEQLVDSYERVVRDMDGDLKDKISELTQLQALLRFYDVAENEYYQALAANDCAAFLQLVTRDGTEGVMTIFGELDAAIDALSRGSSEGQSHPEAVRAVADYSMTRLRGLKLISDTAERTMETIVNKLARQLTPYQHDAQAVINRAYRDSEAIVESASFLPTQLAHVKFRVMGRSLQPVTTMLAERAARGEVPDYYHHLNRLWLAYLAKRLRLVQRAFARQVAYVLESRAAASRCLPAQSLRAACLYFFDFLYNEYDSFYFYFPKNRWVCPEQILTTLAGEFYDVLRSYVISIHDVALLRTLSNETHQLIESQLKSDEHYASLHPPMEALRRDIKNKLCSRLHEIFIRNVSASYVGQPEAADETPIRSIGEMLRLLTDPKLGSKLHLPVTHAAISSLVDIESILDSSVVVLLVNEISEALETKLEDAVKAVNVITDNPVLGSLLACRELLYLHRFLGSKVLNKESVSGTDSLDSSPSHNQLTLWINKTIALAKSRIALRAAQKGKDRSHDELLHQVFTEYCQAVSEYLFSRKYDPYSEAGSPRPQSTETLTLVSLFITPVFTHLVNSIATTETDFRVLTDRLEHWRSQH